MSSILPWALVLLLLFAAATTESLAAAAASSGNTDDRYQRAKDDYYRRMRKQQQQLAEQQEKETVLKQAAAEWIDAEQDKIVEFSYDTASSSGTIATKKRNAQEARHAVVESQAKRVVSGVTRRRAATTTTTTTTTSADPFEAARSEKRQQQRSVVRNGGGGGGQLGVQHKTRIAAVPRNRGVYDARTKTFVVPYEHGNVEVTEHKDGADMVGDRRSINEALFKSKRIVGGTIAPAGKYPWIVSLFRVVSGNQEQFVCTGFAVSRWVALFAGHCLARSTGSGVAEYAPSDLRVYHGSQNLDSVNSLQYEVNLVEVHPAFLHDNFAYRQDIGAVRVTRAIPGPHATLDLTDAHHTPTQLTTVAGFGVTQADGGGPASSRLNEVDLPILTPASCGLSTTTNFICAGAPGKDACFGDSGGPMVVCEDSECEVIAMTSFGVRTSQEQDPCDGYGGYMKLKKSRTFIQQVLALPAGSSSGSTSSSSSSSSSAASAPLRGSVSAVVFATFAALLLGILVF